MLFALLIGALSGLYPCIQGFKDDSYGFETCLKWELKGKSLKSRIIQKKEDKCE